MNELFLFYILLTSIFLLSGVLIIVIQYLLNVIKQNKSYQKDIFHHSQHMIDKAREKAHEIIYTADEKAQEIIKQTEVFSREASESSNEILAELRRSQKEQLERAANSLFEEYKEELENVYRENINLFKNISKSIEEKADLEIKDFKEILEKETLESQKIVGEKIENRYQEVQAELEAYRVSELQKLKDNIYRITEQALILAVGRSLDQETHEALVMDALKEAIEKDKLRNES